MLQRIADIKVVDPACGSGAYLLGMLQELRSLNGCLDTRAQGTPRADYDRKLEIIQSNVYGVDKDEFAVNIARLRLWLSLVVDYDGDDPPSLPNLDFKIEAGDSLTAPNPEKASELRLQADLINQYRDAKARYMVASRREDKVPLREEISNLRTAIASWAHADASVDGFDWPVEFAEVFAGSTNQDAGQPDRRETACRAAIPILPARAERTRRSRLQTLRPERGRHP